MQTTSHLLMIRPVAFGMNAQTAESNAFQNQSASQDNVQQKALAEFDAFVDKLRNKGIDVTVINDTPTPHTPDSIFPNNWISFHADGSIYLYPMQAENRRLERREDIIDQLEKSFEIKEINDLSFAEEHEEYLEGTGSMVLDRDHKIAYACLSIRTQQKVLDIFCKESGFKAVTFNAVDANGMAIYHTNVMMCVADQFVIICLESIPDESEREKVQTAIKESGKAIIEISLQQMNNFAGNMLQVHNANGSKILVMSQSAYKSLENFQISAIEKYCEILYAPIPTIEENGGGSARCMMAEIHLPTKELR